MEGSPKIGRVVQLVLLWASVALILAGCATTASYRPSIDSMKAALAEAKAAGAQMRAPEEYAAAEACLDWLTHEATEFNPFADRGARNVRDKCQVAFAALRDKMVAAAAAAPPTAIPQPQPPTAETTPEVVSPPQPPAPEAAPMPAAEEKATPLKDVFFDFDKWSLRADAKKSLVENVRWLKANPEATLLIEGHCDERGTSEYNLGLGQRRAMSARNYLVAAGIDAKRITVISRGKESPFVLGHDESAWKWNRRAHFVLQ